MQQSLSPAGKERLRVLDVIRGVTMILVVFHHVRGVTFGLYGLPSPLSEFFVAFRMPMFFFISGFVAYKAVEAWDWTLFGRRITRKAMVELVPTAVFFTLFVTLEGWDWTFPGGYWFTVSLFGMLSTYYIVSLACHYLLPTARMMVLCTIAAALYVLPTLVSLKGADVYFPVQKTCSFFIFFVMGVAMGGRREAFFRSLGHSGFIAAMIAVAVASLAFRRFHPKLDLPIDMAVSLAGSASLLIVIFSAFYTRRDYWHQNGRLSRTLQAIGRRTLDIYMIHWFLLPRLPMLEGMLRPTSTNAVIELVIIGSVSLAVVGGCWLISSLLRTSPLLATVLFGAQSAAPTAPKSEEAAPRHESPRLSHPYLYFTRFARHTRRASGR